MKTCIIVWVFLFFCVGCVPAQTLWDGGGGDGQWTTAANWANDLVPGPSDSVLLDNTYMPSGYTVSLPPGTASVAVESLTIMPAAGDSIEVVLPASNTVAPAFTAGGTTYGLRIFDRGVFRNASGAASGTPVQIDDSIRIYDGGRYIHNTARAHAANVTVLSRLPGTEKGIFEFDVPRSSFTLALSGRVFGSVLLSAAANGGSIRYTASGTKPVTVNGNLECGKGVVLNLNFSDTLRVKGDLVQDSGEIDLASSSRSTVLAVAGNIIQDSAGILDREGSGRPTLWLNGATPQHLDMKGKLLDSVAVAIHNGQGVILDHALLLPFLLRLDTGKLYTYPDELLTLGAGCSISVDSNSDRSFIEGPLRKEGLSGTDHFLFPVGKDKVQRWLALKQATGSFVVTYQKEDPRLLSNLYDTGIDHIATGEYWSVQADDNPGSSASVELSFGDTGGDGVTDLSSLRVAQLSGGSWKDDGNSAFTGSPGGAGSVVSDPVNDFTAGVSGTFTLAGSSPAQNPLPLQWLSFHARALQGKALLSWQIDPDMPIHYFKILSSMDNRNFQPLATVWPHAGQRQYRFTDALPKCPTVFYRLMAARGDGKTAFSRIVPVSPGYPGGFKLQSATYLLAGGRLTLRATAPKNISVRFEITDMRGCIVRTLNRQLPQGVTTWQMELPGLTPGIYVITGVTVAGKTKGIRFIKNI